MPAGSDGRSVRMRFKLRYPHATHRRANAVAEFLAGNGMGSGQLRTVSYGEDKNRQVRPGQVGPEGQDNRRVSLVIDYSGKSGG